jgi:hypothetical protein
MNRRSHRGFVRNWMLWVVLIVFLVISVSTRAQEVSSLKPVRVTLRDTYHDTVGGTLRYWGFPFAVWSGTSDMQEMADVGANSSGYNKMWIPTKDPDAPYGAGVNADRLGSRTEITRMEKSGLNTFYWVGNWNNGAFPYYPSWFYDDNPSITAIDQYGRPIYASMFNDLRGWPSIDSPVIVDGTQRYIAEFVQNVKDKDSVIFWVMGGEALYPSYLIPDKRGDYGEDARIHFQKWLRNRYDSIDELNRRWETNLGAFEEVQAPKEPMVTTTWSDWLDFRFADMAERFAWHYQAIRAEDDTRLILTCNHGDPYSQLNYEKLGARLDFYAEVSDGYETGQIIEEEDSQFYNIMYFQSMLSSGKPIAASRLAYRHRDPTAQSGYSSYTPETLRRYVYESMGLGAWHVGLLQWVGNLPDGDWGIRGTAAEKSAKEVFAELEKLSWYLTGSYPVMPKVGIYFSHYTWSLLGLDDGNKALHSEWVYGNIPKVYVYDETDLSDYPVIVSIGNSIVSSSVLQKMEHYVKSGGILILVDDFAVKDEELNQIKRPLFGKDMEQPDGEIAGVPFCSLERGRIFRMSSHDSVNVIDELEQLVLMLSPARYLELGASGEPILSEQLVVLNNDQWNVPMDLAGTTSLGQSFKSLGGSFSILFKTPTFYHDDKDIPLTVQVFRGGVDGQLVASSVIPAINITDNAVQEIVVEEAAPAGTEYYVRFVTPSRLPFQRLGIWATRNESYGGGAAYRNDQPIDGDIYLMLRNHVKRERQEMVQAYLLSDGLNDVAVFINLSDETIDVDVNLDSEYVADKEGRYEVRDPLKKSAWFGLSADRTKLGTYDGLGCASNRM